MEFNTLTNCTSCSRRTICNEQVSEIDNKCVMHFCEECYKQIQDTLKWADEFSKRENGKIMVNKDILELLKIIKIFIKQGVLDEEFESFAEFANETNKNITVKELVAMCKQEMSYWEVE